MSIAMVGSTVVLLGFISLFVLAGWGILWAIAREERKPVEWSGALVGVATVTSSHFTLPKPEGPAIVQFKVDVETPDGEVFPSQMSRRVPVAALPLIDPGLRFPAMYRAGRREKVKIARGACQARAQELFDAVRLRDGLVDAAELDADRRGRITYAQLVDVRDTGQRRGGLPVRALDLRIRRVEGDGEFERTAVMALTPNQVRLLTPGRMLRVKYVPEDPARLVVAVEPVKETS